MLWSAPMTLRGGVRRLTRYTAREVLLPAASAVVVITVLLLTTQILRVGEAAFGYGLTAGDFLAILGLLLPRFLVFTLPIATMIGVVAGLGRLTSDREILALEAAGASPLSLWPGPVILGVVATAATLVLTTTGTPASLRSLSARLAHVVEKNLAAGLKPGVIHEEIPGVTLRARGRRPDGILTGVFLRIAEAGGEATVVATRARLAPVRGGLDLHVEDGELLEPGAPDPKGRPTLTRARFATGRIAVDVSETVRHRVRFIGSLDTLSSSALLRRLKITKRPPVRRKILVLYHHRIAFPFACLALAILGMPLGLAGAGRREPRRGLAFVAGVGLVVAWYLVLRIGEAWALAGRLPPWLAVWIPNVAAFGAGSFLLWRRARR